MIRFERAPEPADFDKNVRQPGLAWLAENPAPRRPKDFWTKSAMPALAAAFRNLCAYAAIETIPGTVDHYRSCKNARELAYEWSNYRYCNPVINQYKGTMDEDIVDPFEIGEDWFEILLPSMQLVATDAIPTDQRERAVFTLKRLRLLGGPEDNWVIRQRRSWYERFCRGNASIELLEEVAPLIARAIRKQQAAHAKARPES